MRMLRAVAGQPWTRVVVMATICCSSALFACLASAGDAPRVMLRAGTAASCDHDVCTAFPEADAKHAIPRPARFASLSCCMPIRAHVHAVGGAGGAGVSNALLPSCALARMRAKFARAGPDSRCAAQRAKTVPARSLRRCVRAGLSRALEGLAPLTRMTLFSSMLVYKSVTPKLRV